MNTELNTLQTTSASQSLRPATGSQAVSGTPAKDSGSTGQAVNQQSPSSDALANAVAKLADAVQSVNRQLSFQVDNGSGRTVITVKDRETDQVIRQIPEEELLQVSENLQELRGLLVSVNA